MVSDPKDWALLLGSLWTGWSWNGPSEERTQAPSPSLAQGGQHSFHRTLEVLMLHSKGALAFLPRTANTSVTSVPKLKP